MPARLDTGQSRRGRCPALRLSRSPPGPDRCAPAPGRRRPTPGARTRTPWERTPGSAVSAVASADAPASGESEARPALRPAFLAGAAPGPNGRGPDHTRDPSPKPRERSFRPPGSGRLSDRCVPCNTARPRRRAGLRERVGTLFAPPRDGLDESRRSRPGCGSSKGRRSLPPGPSQNSRGLSGNAPGRSRRSLSGSRAGDRAPRSSRGSPGRPELPRSCRCASWPGRPRARPIRPESARPGGRKPERETAAPRRNSRFLNGDGAVQCSGWRHLLGFPARPGDPNRIDPRPLPQAEVEPRVILAQVAAG